MTGRAGRNKKASYHDGRRSSEGHDIVNEVLMKEKIKTLEAEVYTLKTRLEALRRAKNTTIVKAGVVRSGRGLTSDYGHGDVSVKCSREAAISELKRSRDQELRSHELEMKELKEQLRAMDHQQDDDNKLHQRIKQLQLNNDKLQHENDQLQHDNKQLHGDKNELQSQLDGVMVANAQLASCNSLLRSKCDQLLEQLSVKEARWSHREEELQLQLRQQWGERYEEWITKAENKMKELQTINQMLQAMLKTKQEHVELQ